MVRPSGMRFVLVVAMVASCRSPGPAPAPAPARPSTTPPSPADAAAVAIDAGVPALDAAAAPIDAANTRAATQIIDVPASAKGVACPTPPGATPGPRWTTPLETWRSRAELPACIAAAIPADVDFDHEMLVAELPKQVRRIELKSPATAPTRDGAWLIVEEQVPSECPVCSGVARPPPPPRPTPPTIVWRISRETGVTPVLRMRPARACPPCMAP